MLAVHPAARRGLLRAGVPEAVTGHAAEQAHAEWEDLRPCAQLEAGTERTGEETDG